MEQSKEQAKTVSLYSKILKEGSSAIDAITGKLKARKDKRAFESAYDSLLEKKDTIEAEKQKFYLATGEYAGKIEKHLQQAWKLRDINDSIDMLKTEYKHIFGETFKVEE